MKNISIYLDRIRFLKKFLFVFLPHLTVRKTLNLLLNELEMHLRITSPRSLPPYIKVEPTPLCHMRCPTCVHGSPELKQKLLPTMMLSLDDLKKIIDPINGTLLGVSLSWLGEPMLHKDICSLIEYLHANNIAVSFPTNLSIPFDAIKAERLVASGLDYMQVALDGASAESYAKYRIGGDFDLVLENVRLIRNAKVKLRKKRPVLVWKFVVFEHNKHEIPSVEQNYASYGFDTFEFVHDDYSVDTAAAVQVFKETVMQKKRACYWIWNTALIRWNGTVMPCCNLNNVFDLGNAIETDLREVWRALPYTSIRAGFVKKTYGEQMHPECRKCMRV